MKNKDYKLKDLLNVGNNVYVTSNTFIGYKNLIDVEHFGDVVVYYMQDGTAYPHTEVYLNEMEKFIEQITDVSVDEQIHIMNSLTCVKKPVKSWYKKLITLFQLP